MHTPAARGRLAAAIVIAGALAASCAGPQRPPAPTVAPTPAAEPAPAPAATPAAAPAGERAPGLEGALERTRALTRYGLRVRLSVTTPAAGGAPAEYLTYGAIVDGPDLSLLETGADLLRPEGGYRAGSAHVIRAGGETYARGPLPLAGADQPVWYRLGAAAPPAPALVITLPAALDALFGAARPAAFRPSPAAGAAPGCAGYAGDEEAGPRMVAGLVPSSGALAPGSTARARLAESGLALVSSSASAVVCGDGLVQRVEASYAARDRAGAVTSWRLTVERFEPDPGFAILAPAAAYPPGPIALPPPVARLPEAEGPAAATLEAARAALDAGDWRGALDMAEAALRGAPGAPQALEVRAEALTGLGRYDEAVASLGELLAAEPGYGYGYRRRAYAHRMLGAYDRAVDDYTIAILLDPRDSRAYAGRAVALGEGLSAWALAEADDTAALAIDPQFLAALRNRAAARRSLRNYEGAVADYTAAIKADPLAAISYRGRAAAYLAAGRWAQAEHDLDVALAIEPGAAASLCNRSIARFEQGNAAGAEADAESAARLAPADPCGPFNRARAREAAGRAAEARADYQEAARLAQAAGDQQTERLAREHLQR